MRPQTSKATLLAGTIVCLLIISIVFNVQFSYSSPRNTESAPIQLGTSQTDTPVREYNLTQGSDPAAIAEGSNHAFWFTEYGRGNISEFIPQNYTFRSYKIPKITVNQPTPFALALDHQGRIWFSDDNQSTIWMFDPANQSFIPHPTKTPKSEPYSVLVDSQDNVWFAENAANNLGVLSAPSYTTMTEYRLPTPNSGPAGLALQPSSSNIWLTEDYPNGDRIAKFDGSTHLFQEFTPQFTVGSPVGIVFDNSGNVWITEHYGSSIDEFFPSNQTYRKFPTSLPPTATTHTYSAPATIVADNQGRLWFEEHLTNKVGRLDTRTGMMEEFLIPSQGSFSVQSTLDEAGNFWFTEYYSDKIGMVPSNATSHLTIQTKPWQSTPVIGGHSIQDSVVITNNLATPIHLELTVTSSFTPQGETPLSELSLNVTSVDLGPGKSATIAAVISPDRTLLSGLYSVAIAAAYTNASAIGILFLQVQSNPTLLDLISSNLPEIVFGSAVILGGAYIILKLRINTRKTKVSTQETRLTNLLDLTIGGLLSLTLLSYLHPITVMGKCFGPTAPNGGFDLFSILLLGVGVAIVAVILFFGVRDIIRWRREQSSAK